MSFDDISEESLRRRTGIKWNLYPADVLPAWVADMDFAVAAPIHAALSRQLDHRDFGYPLSVLHSDLRTLFAERVATRFGWQVEPADVVILNDVVQGIYLSLMTLSAPQDGVIIQTPIYPPFLHAVEETGRHGIICPLSPGSRGYTIDVAALAAAITPSTRVLLFCNPHNPTGRAFTRSELEALAELACRHDLIVVSDEIHADLVLAPQPHIPIASLNADIAARTLTLMSASKAFNIAGLCMAFAHFGSAGLRERFQKIPPHTRGGTNTLSVAAVRAAWRESQPWLDAALTYLRANRDHVAEFCRAQWPTVTHFAPEATYLGWFDMRPLALEPNPYDFFLSRARVALGDGKAFGEAGIGHVRLNFATSRAMLDQVLARMAEAVAARG